MKFVFLSFTVDPLLIFSSSLFLPSAVFPLVSSFLFDLPPITSSSFYSSLTVLQVLVKRLPIRMSKLAVTPINKATGLMRRHPSIRAPDRSSFGSIPEGVKVELHYLPPPAFIVDHSPPTCHSANTPRKPDREGARISPFPDEESFQTFENARAAVQDDDPFGGRHRKLSKSKGPSTTSPVTLGRSDFFGPWEPVKPQPSNHHLQDYRHSPASEPRDPQPLQQPKSFSIGNMPPPSDIIQQKGARVSRSMRPFPKRLIFTVTSL